NADLLASSLRGYQLASTSPMIDAGFNNPLVYGVNVGSIDFYGTSIPQFKGYDIGASEYH
nr:beta-glucosidase [Acidobacteriota bacterium]